MDINEDNLIEAQAQPNGSNDVLLGKKRKYLPKIYQTMLDKNINKTPTQTSKENFTNEISNFQI